MGLATGPDTLLRLIHAAEETSHPTPRVLGVDDFSFRRRISFGTILIDLEKRVPVDPARQIGKPKRLPGGSWPIQEWRSSAGIAEVIMREVASRARLMRNR